MRSSNSIDTTFARRSDVVVPSSFTMRDVSMNKWLCSKDEKRADLLKMAADDCESALFDLQGIAGKAAETQVIKTMNRR